jgi:uncharacterized protein YgbK (DUF1537 family)
MQIRFGVIADDLTGGLIIASLLEREGFRCPLVTSPQIVSTLDEADAVVVARRTRLIPAKDAVLDFDLAATALMDAKVSQIYYKYCATFDSNDDGNIGPCTDLLKRKIGVDYVGFCPAFPDWNVNVYLGYLFLRGQLVSDSPKRFDPVMPMLNPNLVSVLQGQTRIKVGLISHNVLVKGLVQCQREVETQAADGVRYFMMDAIDNADVRRCAELTADWPLMTGGDAIPIFYARLWRERDGISLNRNAVKPLAHVEGHGAVISGSCADATMEQLDFFKKRHPVLRIDLLKAAEDDRVVDRSIDWASNRLERGPIAISTSATPDEVANIQSILGRDNAARLAEDINGKIAAGLLDLGVRRFVIAGGETSGAVIKALGVRRMQVAPFDVPGEGYCTAVDPQPISILLKPGKVGAIDLFGSALEKMRP